MTTFHLFLISHAVIILSFIWIFRLNMRLIKINNDLIDSKLEPEYQEAIDKIERISKHFDENRKQDIKIAIFRRLKDLEYFEDNYKPIIDQLVSKVDQLQHNSLDDRGKIDVLENRIGNKSK